MKLEKNKIYKVFLLAAFVLNATIFVQAQAVQPKNVYENYRLKSKLMAREMPYRVILPRNYKSDNLKDLPVIYLLHGLTGHFDNWTDKTKITEYAAQYEYIIVTPEGGDGWYSDSVSLPNDKYESYIVKELIPEIDKNFRTKKDRNSRIIAGLSMGGYGAIKFGLKYPEMFSLVGSFSGAFKAAEWTDKNSGEWLSKSVMSVFGSAENPSRNANNIYKIVREMPAEQIKSLPFIYLDCGTEDFLIQSNREFSSLLFERKIPHEFRQLPGKHDWKYWDLQVQEFLRLSARFVK